MSENKKEYFKGPGLLKIGPGKFIEERQPIPDTIGETAREGWRKRGFLLTAKDIIENTTGKAVDPKKENEDLKKENADLKGRIEKLEKMMTNFQAQLEELQSAKQLLTEENDKLKKAGKK